MKHWLVILCLLTAAFAQQTSTEQREDAQKKALDITAGLYITLRNVAFPGHDLEDESRNLDGRFLMLMPGKVLNYFDYYPGTDYTNFIQVSWPLF